MNKKIEIMALKEKQTFLFPISPDPLTAPPPMLYLLESTPLHLSDSLLNDETINLDSEMQSGKKSDQRAVAMGNWRDSHRHRSQRKPDVGDLMRMLMDGDWEGLLDGFWDRGVKEQKKGGNFPSSETYVPSTQKYLGQSKNIPKNFGKQLIKFTKQNQSLISKMLLQFQSGVSYQQLRYDLQRRRKKMTKVGDLKSLWTIENKYSRQMRMISCYFLRRFGVSWIFNSRVTGYATHLKYRAVLMQCLKKPESFVQLKLQI